MKRPLKSALALILCLASSVVSARTWVDRSHAYLLPEQVGTPLHATQDFPLFWWNFLILQVADRKPSLELLARLCQNLSDAGPGQLRKMGCGQDLKPYLPLLEAWARDEMRRSPAPSLANLQARLAEGEARLSLPVDPAMLHFLRTDPLSTYRELLARIQAHAQLDIESQGGFFFDAPTRRLVIPIQFAFDPSKTNETKAFTAEARSRVDALPGLQWLGWVGPHGATLENETQIFRDVNGISILGAVFLLVQLGLAVVLRRARLFWLAPPILLSTALSIGLTALMFGRIHGLTLAFGPGIVGLCMDHGLHSCLNRHWKGAWRANAYGLWTTLAALVVVFFSSIPFLRQLMAFSILGLCLGFAMYWHLHRRYPDTFMVEPLPWAPKPGRFPLLVTAVLLLFAVFGMAFLRPNFSLQQMNYQGDVTAELTPWLFSHLKSRSPLLQIDSAPGLSPLKTAQDQKDWAEKNQITVESLADYLPSTQTQLANLASWKERLCGAQRLSMTQQKIFSPFLSNLNCDSLVAEDLKSKVPMYLSDFQSQGRWLSLWMTKSPEQVAATKTAFPNAVSLPEIVNLFPRLVSREALWMAILAIFISSLLLWNYYRDFYLVGLSLLPFFTGLGLFSALAIVFHFQISFISLIALIMVFGLSLDYGIFSANLFTGVKGPSVHGVWTSVVLAAAVTFFGFLPLLFCHHPVLLQLGQALVYGTAGTILGALWGIPSLHWACREGFRAPQP